jgi:hypothetical protein
VTSSKDKREKSDKMTNKEKVIEIRTKSGREYKGLIRCHQQPLEIFFDLFYLEKYFEGGKSDEVGRGITIYVDEEPVHIMYNAIESYKVDDQKRFRI